MRRDRGFPIISTVLALLLAGVVVLLASYDPGLPGRALGQVGAAVAGMGDVLGGWFGGVRFDGIAPRTAEAATPMLVNRQNPVAEGYVPSNLVAMAGYCDPSVVAIKGDDIQGERGAVDALMTMLRAAIDQGVGDWQISAGYRSVAYQQQVWDDKVAEYRAQGLTEEKAQQATAGYVAQPGASEHHTGLAFDVTVPGQLFPLTEQSRWLAANCWDYGFIIRYAEDKVSITGINAEPWHVRYVGQPHATRMRDGNLCLEEYLASQAQ